MQTSKDQGTGTDETAQSPFSPQRSDRRVMRTLWIVVTCGMFVMLVGTAWFAGATYWDKLETDRALKLSKLEREAERKERVRLEQMVSDTRDDANNSEDLAKFALGIISAKDGAAPVDRDLRLSDMLARAAARLDEGAFTNRPELEMRLRRLVGEAFESLTLYSDAEPHFRIVLEMTKSLRGERNPAMIESEWALARVLKKLGKSEKSDTLAAEAQTLYDECMSQVPWGRVPRLYGMAQRQVEAGLYLAAAGQIRYAIAVLDRQYGPDHPLIIQAMIRKAGILSEGQQLVAAEADYRQAIDQLRQRLPPTHPHIADALSGYAKMLTRTVRTDEAEAVARECLSIREASLPEGDWRRASAKCLVGEALLAQRKFEQAEPLLLEGLKELDSQDDTPSARLEDVRNSLVSLYEAWEKPDKADAFRSKRRAKPTTSAPGIERRPGKAIE